MQEIWKTYNNDLEVSDQGRVRTSNGDLGASTELGRYIEFHVLLDPQILL